MADERLLSSRKKTVGAKQTLKALERGQAKAVFVAKDADRFVVDPILQLSSQKGIPIIQVDTMQSLGKACCIEVGCAVAAILE
ncbi:MAG: ribosomal L7Ae/L30e/S12e/Gadd45 family protein [Desulfotomaculaceae bacterium]|nr:ribosomal L7Ae/L30e/S12e/Gadd45 family protein [Desulfotomaculaceae bacterium]